MKKTNYPVLKAALNVLTAMYDGRTPAENDSQIVREYGARVGLPNVELDALATAVVRRILGPGGRIA